MQQPFFYSAFWSYAGDQTVQNTAEDPDVLFVREMTPSRYKLGFCLCVVESICTSEMLNLLKVN